MPAAAPSSRRVRHAALGAAGLLVGVLGGWVAGLLRLPRAPS